MRRLEIENWSPFSANVSGGWDRQSLKRDYLHCLGHLARGTATLRGIVERLLNLGVSRKELVEWAVSEGYVEKSVRKLLSRLRLQSGERLRRPGAGPKSAPEALVILAFARSKFRDQGDKFLHAASRAAKRQVTVKREQDRAAALSRPGISAGAAHETTAPPRILLPVVLERMALSSERLPKTVNHDSHEDENDSATHDSSFVDRHVHQN